MKLCALVGRHTRDFPLAFVRLFLKVAPCLYQVPSASHEVFRFPFPILTIARLSCRMPFSHARELIELLSTPAPHPSQTEVTEPVVG